MLTKKASFTNHGIYKLPTKINQYFILNGDKFKLWYGYVAKAQSKLQAFTNLRTGKYSDSSAF